MEYPVYNMQGKEIEKMDLREEVWNVPPRKEVMHRAVVQYLAGQRQGTSSTLTRGEVRGSGRKPWRQKGTGRARAGSRRSPIWRGGGVAFGPRPRDFSFHIPRKEKRLATILSLSDKVREHSMTVLDELFLESIKTKKVQGMLTLLNLKEKKILLITDAASGDSTKKDEVKKVVLSSRNIKNITTLPYQLLNAYSVLNAEKILLTKKCVSDIEKHLLSVNKEVKYEKK